MLRVTVYKLGAIHRDARHIPFRSWIARFAFRRPLECDRRIVRDRIDRNRADLVDPARIAEGSQDSIDITGLGLNQVKFVLLNGTPVNNPNFVGDYLIKIYVSKFPAGTYDLELRRNDDRVIYKKGALTIYQTQQLLQDNSYYYESYQEPIY